MNQEPPQSDPAGAKAAGEGAAQNAAAPRVWQSRELFADQRVIVIQHAGQPYRLLITRHDRLILQK